MNAAILALVIGQAGQSGLYSLFPSSSPPAAPATMYRTGPTTYPTAAVAPSIAWRTDYPAAIAEAERTGKRLLIYCTMVPCLHCDRLEASTFRNFRIVAALADYIPIKIYRGDLTDRIGVKAFPTIILADAKGDIVRQDTGYVDTDTLLGRLVIARADKCKCSSACICGCQRGQECDCIDLKKSTVQASPVVYPIMTPVSSFNRVVCTTGG